MSTENSTKENQPSWKFYVKTFGCQMNEADSDRMMSILAGTGMQKAEDPEEAEVVIINGCTVREKAVHKALSMLGTLRDVKNEGQKARIIGVGGCVGQLEKEKLFRSAPYLDFVFGTDTIDNLPELIHRVKSGEKHVVYADFDSDMNYSTETKVYGHKKTAFVNIMKGCDKYCTYCIVPFTRGKEKSRTIDEVVEDVAKLCERGIVEVTLLGQNVNSFGKGNPNTKEREPKELKNIIGIVGPKEGEENFPQLLRALNDDPRCKNLKRIRFTSSHPLDFSDELIECYNRKDGIGVERLADQLHLPVQSGSNAVLRKMGRKHKIENYIAQMDRLKEINPEIGLSTDLIVGFPTETEEDFQETLKLLDVMEYDQIYAFAYSVRPGTRAAKLEDSVSQEVKNERLNRLFDHQKEISKRKNLKRVGKVYEILVEGRAKSQKYAEDDKNKFVWTGRTPQFQIVNFVTDSPRDLTGKFLNVKITAATALSLKGEVLEMNPDHKIENSFQEIMQ